MKMATAPQVTPSDFTHIATYDYIAQEMNVLKISVVNVLVLELLTTKDSDLCKSPLLSQIACIEYRTLRSHISRTVRDN